MISFLMHTTGGRTVVAYLLMFVVPLVLPALFVKLVGIQGLRQLFSYEPKQTLLHGLDPRWKILYPVTVGILSVMLNWSFVFLLLGLTLIPWIILKPSATRTRVLLTMTGVPVIGMIWSQGLFHPSTNGVSHIIFSFPWTVSWFGTPGLSATGINFGAEQAGRMLVSVSASLILLLTTTQSEIIWGFYKFRLPATFGFAFGAALRFLPQMIERLSLLLRAMEVRGFDLSAPRWWRLWLWPDYLRRVLIAIPTVTVPLLIGSLRTTSVMAMVADARAFGAYPERTILREHKTSKADRVAWLLLLALVATVLVLVALHIGNRQG